jgi:hypothetical protein
MTTREIYCTKCGTFTKHTQKPFSGRATCQGCGDVKHVLSPERIIRLPEDPPETPPAAPESGKEVRT